ncbi:hypothetical protein LJR039_000119 [Pseudorhodoferax sp. LjRoot39]|uniref:hypothetical protein n=1 Tax=Pseudorhodoferax sp. LjRoot39 TaxID=3342328 RepID=UPI003ED00D2E
MKSVSGNSLRQHAGAAQRHTDLAQRALGARQRQIAARAGHHEHTRGAIGRLHDAGISEAATSGAGLVGEAPPLRRQAGAQRDGGIEAAGTTRYAAQHGNGHGHLHDGSQAPGLPGPEGHALATAQGTRVGTDARPIGRGVDPIQRGGQPLLSGRRGRGRYS